MNSSGKILLEKSLLNIPDKFVFCSYRSRWIEKDEFLKDLEYFRSLCRPLPRDLVVLGIENTYEFLVTYLSFLLEDFCVLLSGRKSWNELENIISSYAPGYIVLDSDNSPTSGYCLVKSSFERIRFLKNESFHPLKIVNTPTSLLLGTSGSTGSPKFVRLSLDNVLANAQSIAESLNIQPEHRAATCLPTSYSFGLSIVNSYIVSGAALVLWDRGILEQDFWSLMVEQKVTSFSGVPYSYQMLRRLGFAKMNLPNLKVMTQAGGKLGLPLVKEFAEVSAAKGIKFYIMYGQTEATARMTCLPAEKLLEKIGSAGKAIPRGALSVLDADPESGVGEIVYSGPNVMLGYATQREDLVRGDELQGMLPTGDIGYVDNEGFLFITGRKKRIAKITGLRVSLDEVESLVASLGSVAAVSQDERIVVYHSSEDQNTISAEHEELAKKMKLHKSLVQFRFLKELPTNSNGKIDYQTLMGLL